MPQLAAFAILTFILYLGDVAATRTKSKMPSIFVGAVLFLVGYWTFFPDDIVEVAGFPTPVVYLAMYLLVTNMGTLLSMDELKRQWRTVVIALLGIFMYACFPYCMARALEDTTAARGALLFAAMPLITNMLGAVFRIEHLTALRSVAIAVAIVLVIPLRADGAIAQLSLIVLAPAVDRAVVDHQDLAGESSPICLLSDGLHAAVQLGTAVVRDDHGR